MVTPRLNLTLFCIAAIALSACGTRTVKTTPENPTEVTSNEILTHSIETVEMGTLYCNEEAIFPPGGIVITELSEWNDFQKVFNSAKAISEVENRTIDFDREMVIGYFDEVRGSLNTSVYIESVTEKLSGLVVNYYVTVNNSDPAAEVLNQPFMLVRMKKRNKPVTFASTF